MGEVLQQSYWVHQNHIVPEPNTTNSKCYIGFYTTKHTDMETKKKPTQWAAMPPFFAWPLIQKPSSRRACPAGLRVLQSSSSFSFGGCFINACAAGPSFAFEGNSALEAQYSVSVVPSSLFGQSRARWPLSVHSKHRPSFLNLSFSSSDIRECLMTPVCRAVSASSSCLRK